MKRKAALLLTATAITALPVSVMAESFNYNNVSVQDEFLVPFSESEEGYFEKGLVPGYGSAITFKGRDAEGNLEFYAISDRGPNADAPKYMKDGEATDAKIFPCPEFTPGIATITVRDGQAEVTSQIPLKDENGNNLTGLPIAPGAVGATNEVALDMDMGLLDYDDNGLDTEGIAVDKDGNFWVCDEYGPFIVKFAPDGTLLEKYAPGNGLPEILSSRIPNRGFEGLSITPSGKILASMQSVLNIEGETAKTACFTRIVELDPETKETKMYAYPVDVTQYKSPKDCKIGDIYAVNDDTLLVIEQGKLSDGTMSNKIYQADLSEASDITGLDYNGKALEYAESLESLEFNAIQKEEYIDLRAEGWTAEKAEGICMTDEGAIAIINDNDFGIVTEVTDAENPDVSITDYIYDGTDGTYTLDGKEASPEISIKENTEPAQLLLIEKE